MSYSLRTLAKTPGFTIVAIGSLALGLGVATTAFTYVDLLRFRALPYPDGGRLVAIADRVPDDAGVLLDGARYTSLQAWSSTRRTIEDIAGVSRTAGILAAGTVTTRASGAGVSPSYFSLLGVPILAGRAFGVGDAAAGAPPVILLSERVWRSKFGGDTSVVGSAVQLGSARPTVVGIVGASFADPVFTPDYWVPLAPQPSLVLAVLGRLAPGASRAQAQAELASATPLDSTGKSHAFVTTLRSEVLRGLRGQDLFIALAAGAVLLITCVNLVGLFLARHVARQREFAIRIALGAESSRIGRQLGAESLLLALVGGVLGGIVAIWGVKVLGASGTRLNDLPLGLEARVDARVFAFLSVLTWCCAAAISWILTRRLSRGDIHQLLRGPITGALRGGTRIRTQDTFVIVQLACASMLLGVAGIVGVTFLKVSSVDVGFDPAPLAQVRMRPAGNSGAVASGTALGALVAPALNQIAGVPGTKSAAVWGIASVTLSRGAGKRLLNVAEDTRNGILPLTAGVEDVFTVDTNYFAVLGVPLLSGRTFSAADDHTSPPVAIVDERTAQRWWPGQTAIGRRVRIGSDSEAFLTIVGVAGSTRGLLRDDDILRDRQSLVLFRPWAQSPAFGGAFFYVRSTTPRANTIVAPLRRGLLRLVPGGSLDIWSMTERYDRVYAPMRTNTLVMVTLAALGLALALIGVYGVVAYTVGQRTQEIGIRVALGAGNPHIIRLVMRNAVVMSVFGLGAGLLGALGLQTAIRALLLDAPATSSPLGLLAAATVFLCIVLVGSYIPARRAMRVDPLTSLRAG